jgi:hypothetical protein
MRDQDGTWIETAGDRSAVGRDNPQMETTLSALAPPRYVPHFVVGAPLAAWHDRQEDVYLVLCPECHRLIVYGTPDALYLAMVWCERQCCRGCRARISFEHNPNLIGKVLDHWLKTGSFPQSPSWVEALPWPQCMIWAKEIQIGLEVATAPIMYAPSRSLE